MQNYLPASAKKSNRRGDSDAPTELWLVKAAFPRISLRFILAIIDGPSGANSSPCVSSVAASGRIIAVRKFDGRSGPNHHPCNRVSQEAHDLKIKMRGRKTGIREQPGGLVVGYELIVRAVKVIFCNGSEKCEFDKTKAASWPRCARVGEFASWRDSGQPIFSTPLRAVSVVQTR